jgi:anti-sigma-K factor RskA
VVVSAQAHDSWRDDLAAYLLGALEPQESQRLERHLDECEECRERLEWLRTAVDVLPESVPQLEPPPDLRARLMQEVRESAAQPRTDRARGGGLRGWLDRPAAVALATVALIAAGVAGYELGTGGGGASTTTLTGPQAKSGALAKLERSGDSGTLQVSGLSQLPRSQVYQAWVQRDGHMEPSSLFAARSNGRGTAAIPHGLDGAQAVVVTVEPHGGSRQPTSSPLVSVPVS